MASASFQRATSVAVRICFAIVFFLNVQCASLFIVDPASYMGGYQLDGLPGRVAVQGIGVAFLMWNATYPLFIVRPHQHRTLGIIILIQQIIGFIGEFGIWLSLPPGNEVLSASIARFMVFDGIGFLLMAASFGAFWLAIRRDRDFDSSAPETPEELEDPLLHL